MSIYSVAINSERIDCTFIYEAACQSKIFKFVHSKRGKIYGCCESGRVILVDGFDMGSLKVKN